ncbi:MAG: IclR family transcriptional regulator [Bacteroidetes bacterium]|nr:IclR family transcriptional regulator [Bacteroidota bacterium]
MAEKKKEREYAAPAVDRALDILELLAKNHRPYGATEIARELQVPLNSVFRILKRLTERDYTNQDPVSGGYQLSTRVFTLGMSLYTRFDLRHRARPHLEWLCRETEETCQLQVPQSDKMMVMDSINPESEFYLRIVPGSLLYYHPNAYGKVVLAFMNEEQVKSILPPIMVGLTPNTIINRDRFMEHLGEIRKTGLGYDNEEYTSGLLCIGAPVFNFEAEPVAGLGATCLLSTINDKKKAEIENQVLQCAHNVSRDIGYTGDFFNDKIFN